MTENIGDIIQTGNISNDSGNKQIQKKKRAKSKPALDVSYGEIDKVSAVLSDIPEVPQRERKVESREEIIGLLKIDIIGLLKKGYSTLAAADIVNSKLPALQITDDEVKKLLPFVTKKRRATVKKDNTNQPGNMNNDTQENSSAPITPSRISAKRVRLDVPYKQEAPNPDVKEVKALGAKYDAANPNDTFWYVLPGDDLNKFSKWLPKD